MGTYKVIQDIEAEDHILGPLSLRQFIFGLLAALNFYLCYIVISKGAPYLVALFLPPGLFLAFFAFPFGRDQPTEIWALAKIRFFFKPRKRIWDQNGIKDLVTVTVPKKIEVRRTDGLSETEVRSRLSALANTIDSRGWAVKNVDLNLYTQSGVNDGASDRLIQVESIPQQVPAFEVTASDDIMDATSNPIAQQFDSMINASTQARHQQLVDMLQHDSTGEAMLPSPVYSPAPQDDDSSNWFMQQASPTAPTQIVQAPVIAIDDNSQVSDQLRAQSQAQDVVYGHMKTIQPMGKQAPVPQPAPVAPPKQLDPVTAQLSTNNDLNISTLARVASKKDLPADEEVIIPLH